MLPFRHTDKAKERYKKYGNSFYAIHCISVCYGMGQVQQGRSSALLPGFVFFGD